MKYKSISAFAFVAATLVVAMVPFSPIGKAGNIGYAFAQMGGMSNNTSGGNSSMSMSSSTNQSTSSSGHLSGRGWGTISSIQNDNNGTPTWLVSGYWMIRLDKASADNSTNPDVNLRAVFTMVKLDGTAKHEHRVSDFKLTNMSDTGAVTTLNGTATVTLKDGPHSNVPLSIKVLNHNVISFWFDPKSTDSHFGNTPVYGAVAKLNAGYHSIVHAKTGMKMTGSMS
jgi:hypothetical protein